MRSLQYYRRQDADAQLFTLGYAYSLSVAFGNTLTAYVHSTDLACRVNQLAFGVVDGVVEDKRVAGVWADWSAKIRAAVKAGVLPSRLTAHLDEIGRAGFLTAVKGGKSAAEATLFDEFSKVLEVAAAVHQPVPSWSKHVLGQLLSTQSVSAELVFQPALVTPKVHVRPAELASGKIGDLFRSPSLNQKFCMDISMITTIVDSVRWNNPTFSLFCDAKTIEGVAITNRATFDLMTKRMQLKSGVILWLLYEIQPLVAYANLVLPLYRKIQAKHLDMFGSEDRAVKRADRLIEAVEKVASLPLHELWSAGSAVNRSSISVDSIFGVSEGWLLPGIFTGTKDLEGDVIFAHNNDEPTIPMVTRDKMLADAAGDDNSVIAYVKALRTVADDRYNTVDASSGLWPRSTTAEDTSEKVELKNWLDWRTLAMTLSNLVGLAELVAIKNHLGWTTGVSTVGEIAIDNRGSDFAFTDTDGYQKNVWQVLLGITPSIALSNPAVFKHYLDSDLSFGKGANRLRWSLISFSGHFGDYRTHSALERYYIPESASCKEEGSAVKRGLKISQPNVAAYYRSIFENGIVGPDYSTTAPLVDVIGYKQDSWDGAFTAPISSISDINTAVKAMGIAIAKQHTGNTLAADEASYVHKAAGFNKRAPVHYARSAACLVISNYYEAFAQVEDNCSVTWDSDSETEVDVSHSSSSVLSTFLDMHVPAIQAEVKGGYSVAINKFVDSE